MSLFSKSLIPAAMAALLSNATQAMPQEPTSAQVVGQAIVTSRIPKGMCGEEFAAKVVDFNWEERWQSQLASDLSRSEIRQSLQRDGDVLVMALMNTHVSEDIVMLRALRGVSKEILEVA